MIRKQRFKKHVYRLRCVARWFGLTTAEAQERAEQPRSVVDAGRTRLGAGMMRY